MTEQRFKYTQFGTGAAEHRDPPRIYQERVMIPLANRQTCTAVII
jgi:hypothetical protein